MRLVVGSVALDPASLDRLYPARGWRVRRRVRGRGWAPVRRGPDACVRPQAPNTAPIAGVSLEEPERSAGAARLDTSAAGVVRLVRQPCRRRGRSPFGHPRRAPHPASGDSRPRPPALDAARARRCSRHRRPAQHPRVLPGVKARRCAPAASRLSALTPGPRALRTGNCPTMPHSDPALSHPEARPSRWIRQTVGRENSAALRPRPEPIPPPRPTTPAEQTSQAGTRDRKRRSGAREIEREDVGRGRRTRGEPGERQRGTGRRREDGRYDQSTTTLAHDTDSCHEPADPMYVHRGWRGAPPLRTLHGSRRVAAGSAPRHRGARRSPRWAAAPVIAGQRLAAGLGAPSRYADQSSMSRRRRSNRSDRA